MVLAWLAYCSRPLILVALFFGSRVYAQTVAPEFPSMPFGGPTTTGVHRVSVVVKHVTSMTVKQVLGEGHSVDLWTVGVCNDGGDRIGAPRVRVMAAFPFTDLPNDLAEDVVGRQTANDPKSIIGETGDTILGLGSTGLTLGGIATGTAAATWAGVGMTGVQLVFRFLAKRAPSATPYFSKLLPDSIGLDGSGCGQWYLFASPMRNPHTMTASVLLP